MPSPSSASVDKLLSPLPADARHVDTPPNDETGLCLSGGGYRAMLFHVGVLWRLNELKYLKKLSRIASVSGGSITAGVLGLAWSRLTFENDVATNFGSLVVDPLRRMADTSIDVSSVLTGALLPGLTISDIVARRYAKSLYSDATLQALPDSPVFVFCATSVQTGSLLRFTKKYIADWQVGSVANPTTPIASVVAASSAFPPVLSPSELKLPSAMQPFPNAPLCKPPYNKELVLSDGGVYDNLGLEPIWKRCATVLVSDAGQKLQAESTPAEDWPRHMARVLAIIDNQVRSLRKRQVIESFTCGARKGSYWGIRTNISDYGLASALPCPHDATLRIAAIDTRLSKLSASEQEHLINWGYAVCDAGMRRHVLTDTPAPAGFPYPRGVS